MILVPNGAEDLCGTLTNATGWMEGKDFAWIGKKEGRVNVEKTPGYLVFSCQDR